MNDSFLNPVDLWTLWRSQMSDRVQVLLDHAVQQHTANPTDRRYFWVRPTVERGIPPWHPLVANFIPDWPRLWETEGQLEIPSALPPEGDPRWQSLPGTRFASCLVAPILGRAHALSICNRLSFLLGETPAYIRDHSTPDALPWYDRLATGFQLPFIAEHIDLLLAMEETLPTQEICFLAAALDTCDPRSSADIPLSAQFLPVSCSSQRISFTPKKRGCFYVVYYEPTHTVQNFFAAPILRR